MRTIFSILILLVPSVKISAIPHRAGDVSGKWSGSFERRNAEGETQSRPVYMILTQQGNTLTGSGGPTEGEQHPIQNGKIEGNRLTFEVTTGKGTLYFDLAAEGHQIQGDVRLEEEGGTISLKRAAGPLRAGDVSGKWSGTWERKNDEGETQSRPVDVTLTQQGNTLTGSGGPTEGEQHPIQNGKIEGNRLTLEVATDKQIFYLDLTARDDQIRGNVKRREGGAKISLKRMAEK